jgi:hypothetical protein
MLNKIKEYTLPGHWFLIEEAFGDTTISEIEKLFPETPVITKFDGRRAAANEFRQFITRDNDTDYLFAFLDTEDARDYFTGLTGVDCTEGKLRIELCIDGPGFYLNNHIDIPEKLITLLIFVGDGPEYWGTSVFDSDNEYVRTVPFKHNAGWLTHKNADIIHGVRENTIDGIRKSVIINYVVGDWRDTTQLY